MSAQKIYSVRKKGKPVFKNNPSGNAQSESACNIDSLIYNWQKRYFPESWQLEENRRKNVFLIILLSLVTIILIAPFAGKAFHIDDPLYLWTAKHILQSPFDFYGFNVNWYGKEEPMSQVMKNPPLVSYYQALIGLLFGWGEVTMHLAMLVPAVFAIAGIFFLAGLLCRSPVEAALISLLTPVFLVSSNTVMCDVFMLSFWVWSVWFWITGLEKNKFSYLAVSAFLMTAASLSKYPAIALIPLLFAYSFFKKHRFGLWAFFFIIPILLLGSYQWYTHLLYGKGLLTAAADFPEVGRSEKYTAFVRGITGLDFMGGCIAGSFFYIPFLWRKRYVLLGCIALLVTIAILPAFKSIGEFPIHNSLGYKWAIIIQFSLFFLAGLHIFILAVTDLWTRRDSGSVLLFVWVGGIFVFTSFVNWTINARSVLTMLPAAAILVVRRMEIRSKIHTNVLSPSLALLPSMVLALLVTYSDYRLANCGYHASVMINRKYQKAERNIWYDGHWGFQYYMDIDGAKSLIPDLKLSREDIIVFPENTPMMYGPDRKKFEMLDMISLHSFPYLATLRISSGAGFYADIIGPLPYAFGKIEPERYAVWKPGRQ
jgi:4-amino-4-deoxy-L-arabinose transferase-like glycosyltransferase